MSLTEKQLKNAKSKETKYKLTDEKGLFVLILPNGAKYFRFKYYFAGKQKELAIGVYPDMPLTEARDARDEARKLVRDGKDPAEIKKANKYNIYLNSTNVFEEIAAEWHASKKARWSESHAAKKWWYLEKNVLPYLGSRPIKNITIQELLSILRIIEKRGALDVAHRCRNIVGEVYAFAIATGRVDRNIAYDLKGALAARTSKHMATITDPKEVGALMRAIDAYPGDTVTYCALRLSPLVFLRPGELRAGEWAEIDFEQKLWKIPGSRMKMKRAHIVPLSNQALAILREIHSLTGSGKYIFPSIRSKQRPMSNVTVLAALRRMGYEKDEMCAHGFRGMASTLLHENRFPSEIVEMQLAHAERNKVKAAYNHAEYLDERIAMMQWWADYLDELKAGDKVAVS